MEICKYLPVRTYISTEKSHHSTLCECPVRPAGPTPWYLRSDFLRLMADFHGEPAARKKLDETSEMLRGMVSGIQMPSARRTIR